MDGGGITNDNCLICGQGETGRFTLELRLQEGD